jgi:hypothetical protein
MMIEKSEDTLESQGFITDHWFVFSGVEES